MRITLNSLILPFFALFLLASCEKGESNGMSVGRTVLIYMAADNNLSSYARQNIEDMKRGDVPAYFATGSGDVLLVYADIKGETPRLIRLSKDRFGDVNEEILMEYEDQNSCSDSVMREVLSYAAGLFPSSENGLVLWSHGTGWLPEGYYSNPTGMSPDGVLSAASHIYDPYAAYVKSFGADGGAEMDIRDLADALPVHYSFILMDACLMGGVEVAYELKDRCDYFLSSAAEVLASGFPYDKVVGELFKGKRGLENVCRLYYENYQEQGATVSMVDARKLDQLAEACLDIFLSGGRDAVRALDVDSVQGYFRLNRHWFYDLDDFIFRISLPTQGSGDEGGRYEVFRRTLDEAVVCKWYTEEFVLGGISQFSINKFSGLSTYIPNPENPILDEYYRTLAWNKAVMMVE